MEYKNINSILIANRGEIASRVIRTCKRMGIRNIAVFSEADKQLPYVLEADTAYFIGESPPALSYLNQDKIIQVAKEAGADAIHPGYGFLSENIDFAERCKKENIIFIGPNTAAMKAMASKSEAKIIMRKSGVPVVPGYEGELQDTITFEEQAEKIGYPVLLKASAGGGGKGMRIVNSKNELEDSLLAVKREAKAAFGNDHVIIEKYVSSGRHIEVQLFGDKYGNALHLFERECTLQRRYQKVIEESPSPVLDDSQRKYVTDIAVKAAKAINYDNAGTIEFIYDNISKNFYFLEVNTRLQVEHPVTEEITGFDLVQMQIEVAEGYPLTLQQTDINSSGYAIECRLYAEDPKNNFLPGSGKIEQFSTPNVDGFRLETGIKSSSEISIYYDPMIAKLIVRADSRRLAHQKMRYVLQNTICLGIKTNQSFLLNLLQNPSFGIGEYDTHFIENNLSELLRSEATHDNIAAIAATLFLWQKRENNRSILKSIPSGWRSNFYESIKETFKISNKQITVKYRFISNGKGFIVTVEESDFRVNIINQKTNKLSIQIDSQLMHFTIQDLEDRCLIHSEVTGQIELEKVARLPTKEKEQSKGSCTTPMPSEVIEITVKKGDNVKVGDKLVVLSSMKMENNIFAEIDGVVEEIYATKGQHLKAGFLLMKITKTA